MVTIITTFIFISAEVANFEHICMSFIVSNCGVPIIVVFACFVGFTL